MQQIETEAAKVIKPSTPYAKTTMRSFFSTRLTIPSTPFAYCSHVFFVLADFGATL
jgi:hypothetical protein